MYDVAESTEEGMISRINSGERWVGLDKHEWHVSIVHLPPWESRNQNRRLYNKTARNDEDSKCV